MARPGRGYRNPTRILRIASRALVNNGGGQADETTVSAANSVDGGARWDLVTIGADATIVYDDVAGRTWYRYATGATTTTARVDWTSTSVGSGWPRYYGRLYFMIPAATLGTTTFYLLRARAGSNQSTRISVSTGSKIQLRNAGNSAAGTGAVSVVGDTPYRLEWDITVGAAAPGEVRLYAGDSLTPLETISTASADFGTAAVDEFGFGIFTSTANHPEYRMRGFLVNNSGLPGPLGDLPTGGSSAGADTVTLTDSITRVQALIRDTADSVTVADTMARGPLTGERALAEAVTVADSMTAYTVRARDLADAVQLVDSATRIVAWTRNLADTVTVADEAASSPVTGSRQLADTVTVADAVTRAVTRPRALAEAVTVADAAARGPLTAARGLAEAVTVSDTLARAVTRARGLADAVTVVDAIARGPLTGARALTETVGVADTLARAVVLARAVADAVTVADTMSASGGNVRSLTDAVQLLDAVTRAITRARGTADAVVVADTLARTITQARAVGDTVALADAVARGPLTGVRALAETLTLADVVDRLSTAGRALTDSVQLVDAVTATGGNVRGLADAVTLTDSAGRGPLLISRSLADAVTLADAVAWSLALQRMLADSVTFADAATASAPPSTTIVAAEHWITDTTLYATITATGVAAGDQEDRMSGVVDVGEALELTFNASTGALVTASWLDPDQMPVIDGVTVPENPPASGKYPQVFVPSVAGVWTALFNGPGQPQTYWVRARALLGPLPFAVVGDIRDQFGAMTTAQEGLAGHLVRAASALLRHQVPDLQANVTSGKVDAEVAALAVTNMVLRVMRNPQGLRAETTGPFSRTYDTTAAAGLLVVTKDDLAAVTPVEEPPPLPDGLGSLGIGTIRIVPGMAPPVDRARWIGGPRGGY